MDLICLLYTSSCLFFAEQPVLNYQTAKTSDTAEFARYFHWMLDHHIHLAPSQFEAIFLSAAHTKKDVDETLDAAEEFFRA